MRRYIQANWSYDTVEASVWASSPSMKNDSSRESITVLCNKTGIYYSTNKALYNIIGRYMSIGVRVRI